MRQNQLTKKILGALSRNIMSKEKNRMKKNERRTKMILNRMKMDKTMNICGRTIMGIGAIILEIF